MSRGLPTLVLAQFLSAFGDNAILFTVIAMTLVEGGERGAWYIPALQSAFLVAYVTLTPWVGRLADRHSKSRILLAANLLKGLGALAIYAGLEPLLGYAVIGVGAATYGPAKYGIIPELTSATQLVRANGWVEGATIAAILFGTVGGARLADFSIPLALIAVVLLYLVSGLATLMLPGTVMRHRSGGGSPWGDLALWMNSLLGSHRARLILLSLSLFWACAATLRVVLVAWAPEVLHADSASDIADLTFFIAIGIVIGAGLVPRLIPLDRVRRTRFSAYLMGVLFLWLAGVKDVWMAKMVLLVIGICGGMFVVPLNAAIQDIGHRGIGSGCAVAVQNFFQNGAILVCMGAYSIAAASGVGTSRTIFFLGGIVLLMTLVIARRLPRFPAHHP